MAELVGSTVPARGRFTTFLISCELWVVGGLVLAGVLSERALPFASAGALFFWGIRRLVTGIWSTRTPVDWSIALLVLILPVTFWASSDLATTVPQIWRLLSGIALYYAIANWASSVARLRLLVSGAVLAGLLFALSAPFSVTTPTADKLPFIPNTLYEHSRPLVSDPVNPNVMAGTLVILLPCALALLLFAWRVQHWATRLLIAVSLLGMSVILVLTQSRGGIIAFAGSIAVVVLLRWRFGWLMVLMTLVLAAMSMMRLDPAALLELLTPSRSLEGAESRPVIWWRAIAMIQDHPVTGIGMGLFQPVADHWYPFMSVNPEVPHAHQLLLQVAVDLGLPGLISWLAILFGIVAMNWSVYRTAMSTNDRWLAGLGTGLLASQAGLVLHGLVDAVTWGMVRTAVVLWGLWGLVSAAHKLSATARRLRKP